MERVTTAAPPTAGTFGIGEEGALPARGSEAGVSGVAARPKRSWLGIGARIVRNAAIAVALMAAVPMTLITVNGDRVWRMAQYGANTRGKTIIAERARPLVLPRDASITPARAGQAYALLQTQRKDPSMPMVVPAARPERTWESLELTDAMFPTARPDQYEKSPSSGAILEAVAKGFTPEEREYLRALATSPVWREYDIVARAPAVDLVGGYLKFPLPADARWEQLPVSQFRATRELAYAGVSRAAYHLSVGQRDSAEAALRAIVSFGFALVDNGTNLMDQLVGDVMIGIGRDALGRFFALTGDPRAGTAPVLGAQKGDAGMDNNSWRGLPDDELRRRVIARATDPATPRGERFETLRLLTMSSCSSVRDIVLGPPADVRNAIEGASRLLGRFASEREIVRLAREQMIIGPKDALRMPVEGMLVSISTPPGIVLNRPQLGTCAVITAQRFFGP
jgi:hypothetical protein